MNEFGNFTNALFDSINSASSIYDQRLKEQAQVDLIKMDSQSVIDETNFINNLKNSGDIENWEKKTNDYYSDLEAKFSDNSPDNPYYCRNSYTAKLAQQQLQKNRANMLSKVNTLANEELRGRDLTSLMSSMQQYANAYTGYEESKAKQQECLDAAMNGGLINGTQYSSSMRTMATNAALKEMTSVLRNNMDSLIKNGATVEQAMSTIGSDGKQYTYFDKITKQTETVDRAELISRAKKEYEGTYKAKQSDYWKKSESIVNDDLSDINLAITDLMTGGSQYTNESILKMINTGAMKLDKMNETSFEPGKKNALAEKYKALAKGVTDSIDKLQKDKDGESKGVLMETLLKNQRDSLLTYYMQGKLKYNTVEFLKGEYKRNVINEMAAGNVKDRKVNNEKEAIYILEANYATYFETLESKVYEKVMSDPRYAAVKDRINKLTADVNKHPENYGENTVGFVVDNLMDLLGNNDLTGITPGEITAQVNKWIDSSYAAQIDVLTARMNKNAENGIITFESEKQRKEYFSNAAAIGEDNDVMYGEKNGTVLNYKTEAEKKAVEESARNQRSEIAAALGVEYKDLKDKGFIKDKYGDEKPVPQFEYNGKLYHIESVRKDKFFGSGEKVTDYKIIDNEGNEIKKADFKQLKKDAEKKRNEEKAAANDNINRTSKNTFEKQNEREENYAKAVRESDAPQWYTGDDWKEKTVAAREFEISNRIEQINRQTKEGKKLLSKLNLSYEYWKSLPESQKQAYLLK